MNIPVGGFLQFAAVVFIFIAGADLIISTVVPLLTLFAIGPTKKPVELVAGFTATTPVDQVKAAADLLQALAALLQQVGALPRWLAGSILGLVFIYVGNQMALGKTLFPL